MSRRHPIGFLRDPFIRPLSSLRSNRSQTFSHSPKTIKEETTPHFFPSQSSHSITSISPSASATSSPVHPLDEPLLSPTEFPSSDSIPTLQPLPTNSINSTAADFSSPSVSTPAASSGFVPFLRRSVHFLFLSSYFNILMVCIPFAAISRYAGWGDVPTFILAILSLSPVAERVSFVTDDLCKYSNPLVGSLLSASMGNLTELIISITMLSNGLVEVVQLSLIGSIISCLLFVLGCSFFFGGLKYRHQKFSRSAAATNTGLLVLSVMGIMIPMILTQTLDQHDRRQLQMSRFTSVILLTLYAFLVIYQLKYQKADEFDSSDSESPPVLGWHGGLLWCLVFTTVIGLLSQLISDAIEGAASSMGVPLLFLSMALLPSVGNASELFSAVMFARKDKMDIALGVAVGSATQIALFVLPICVVYGWASDRGLSLDFRPFETAVLFNVVIMTSLGLNDGVSDWFKGVILLGAYAIVAASFWIAEPPPLLIHEGS